MSKSTTYRFASGAPDALFSSIWRLVVAKKDVYLGAGKTFMGCMKFSLHRSGVWLFSATEQSGCSFEDGNRRAKQWRRPPPDEHGIVRGPLINIPFTSIGSRPIPPDEELSNVRWYRPPNPGELVRFSMYFTEPGSFMRTFGTTTKLIDHPRGDGSRVVLIAAVFHPDATMGSTVEGLLSENVCRIAAPESFKGGSFFRIMTSRDQWQLPVVLDLPVPTAIVDHNQHG